MRATVCTSSKIALTSKEARHFGEPRLQKQLQRIHLHNILVATVKVFNVPSNVHGFHIHTLLWVTAISICFCTYYYRHFSLNSKVQNSLCSHIVATVQLHTKNQVSCTIL